MGVVYSQKMQNISEAADPKQAIIDAVGDLSGINLMFNQVLVGTYFRPSKTKGGIILTQNTVQEDEFQSKVGLVLKKGPTAFVDDETNQFYGQDVEIGQWIVYRVGDGWSLTLNGTACRLLPDSSIKMTVNKPDAIF